MKLKLFFILYFSFFIFHFSFSQATFQKYYDRDFGTNNSITEVGHSIRQTADGGFIAVGYSDNYGIGLKDVYMVRMNSAGDTLWTKLYGSASGHDMARAVIETSDGGFALACETQSGAGGIDAVIMKTDSVGNLLWSKAFGGTDDELGHSIIEMNDGGLVLAGEALSFSGTGYEEIFLVKVDASGNLVWSKTLSGGSGDIARGIAKTADGGFIVSGDESSLNYGVCLAKFDVNGDTTWCHTYRGAISAFEGYSVNQTIDGGYVMAANTFGGSIGSKDMVILRLTSSGMISWATELGTINSDVVTDVIETADGGYVASGTAMPGGSYSEITLSKLNASGTLQWSKGYTGDFGITFAMDERYEVIETSDNGLATIGSIYNNFGNTLPELYNGYDMMILKVDSAGGGLPFGCVKDVNLQSAPAAWSVYSAPFAVTNVNPIVTNAVFTESLTAGNNGDVGIKLNFTTTPVSCGQCDGSAMVDPCDTNGFYCSGKNPYSYQWDTATGGSGQVTQNATGLCTGSYTITVTDFTGCTGIGSIIVNSAALAQEICLITVDSTSTKNIIVWQKPVTTAIDSFKVYRDIVGTYTHIGSVPYDSLSQFIDTTNGINPNITSYRYKISTVDTCGNESTLSAHHETIHLTSNVGTSGEANLIWDDYEGFSFTFYRILRDTMGNGNFEVIDSVSSTNFTYTDLNTFIGNTYYAIEVVPPSTCTATKSAENYNSSRSNINQKANLGPSADFTASQTAVTQGNAVNFTDQSLYAPTSWQWTFTGGTPANSTSKNPVITYNDTGCYDVTLVVSNANGTDSIIKTCYIQVAQGVPPTVDFSASTTNVTVGSSINFSDLSGNTPTSWSWTFQGGNPSSSAIQNPININYNAVGCYDVILVSTNVFGTDSLTKICYINVTSAGQAPVADFAASAVNITQGDSVTFVDLSSNTPTSWNWVFTGGTPFTSSLQSPTIIYNDTGCFNVSLQVSNTSGNDTETKLGYICVAQAGSVPVAAFTANNTTITAGGTVDFTDQSANTPTSWQWTFTGGNPSSSILQNPINITYADTGCYEAILVATNALGNDMETKTCYITVNAAVGIKYQVSGIGYQVFPNPNDGIFEVKIMHEELRMKNVKLEVRNVLGEQVYQSHIPNLISQISIDLSAQPIGIYFLKLETSQVTFTQKISISR